MAHSLGPARGKEGSGLSGCIGKERTTCREAASLSAQSFYGEGFARCAIPAQRKERPTLQARSAAQGNRSRPGPNARRVSWAAWGFAYRQAKDLKSIDVSPNARRYGPTARPHEGAHRVWIAR